MRKPQPGTKFGQALPEHTVVGGDIEFVGVVATEVGGVALKLIALSLAPPVMAVPPRTTVILTVPV